MILNSPYITGSITVTGNTTIQGSLIVTGSLSGTASLASNSNLLQGTGSVGFATTASLLAVSSSQQQISSSQQQISSSLLTLTASYAALSSSYISLSASYNTFSGSASTRTTQIEQTYATTGSNSFRANQSITGSLVVSSTITAQTLVVQTVTSSIVYSSGSNNFGNQLSNNQTFTGSVNITGSLNVVTTGTEFQVTNTGVAMGNLLTDAHRITGSLSVTGSTHSIFGNVGIGTADLGPDGLSLSTNFNYVWSEGSGNAYATLFRQRNSAATVMASGYKRSNTGAFASSYGISMARAAIAIGSNNGSIAFFSDPSSNVANGTDITPSERVTILNSGNVGIGTTTPVTALEVLPSITNSSIKTGGIEIQSYAVNNSWIGDNMYYSGSWKARATGYSTNVYFGQGTINFTRAASTGSGATIFPTSSMLIDASGRVGIGYDAPDFPLAVFGTNVSQGDSSITAHFVDKSGFAAGVGGGIAFGGYYASSTYANSFAYIQGIKENATSGDFAGALKFGTRVNGGSVTERMRIASNGDLTVKGSTHTIYTNSSNTISFDINSTRGRFYQALSVDGAITAASTVSESGTTSVPWATWTTVKTLPNYQNAIYLFVGYLNGYINYTTYATILQNDSAAVATNYYSSVLQLQMSGRDIQVYQNSGSTQSIGWKLLKIS